MYKTYEIQSSKKMNTIRQLETAQIYILESLFSPFQLRLHSPIEMHVASVYIIQCTASAATAFIAFMKTLQIVQF